MTSCACIECCRLILQWLALDSVDLTHICCTSNKSWATNPEIIQWTSKTNVVLCVPPGSEMDLTSSLTFSSVSLTAHVLSSCLPLSHRFSLSFCFFSTDKCVYSGIRVWTVVFVPSLSLAWHSLRHTKSPLITLSVSCLSRPEAGCKDKNKRAKGMEKTKEWMNWERNAERKRKIERYWTDKSEFLCIYVLCVTWKLYFSHSFFFTSLLHVFYRCQYDDLWSLENK